jgi:hypothetical protein
MNNIFSEFELLELKMRPPLHFRCVAWQMDSFLTTWRNNFATE